jgi:hypothetical protein
MDSTPLVYRTFHAAGVDGWNVGSTCTLRAGDDCARMNRQREPL